MLVQAQLVAGAVDDQPRRRARHLVHDHQAVLGQGAAGLHQVDDPVGEPQQGRQLDRPGDAHQLHLHAAPREEPAGALHVLGGHPRHPAARQLRIRRVGRRGHGEGAAAEAQVQRAQDIGRALVQHVEAHHPGVGDAGLHVHRHVAALHRQELEAAVGRGKDQPARLQRGRVHLGADPPEEEQRLVHHPALGKGDPERAHPSSPTRSAMASVSRAKPTAAPPSPYSASSASYRPPNATARPEPATNTSNCIPV